MSGNQEDYKEWQDRHDSLNGEYDEEWDDETKRDHYENMRIANEMCVLTIMIPAIRFKRVDQVVFRELEGRLEARDEWGDDGNDGHDHRIDSLRDQDQVLAHGIAYHEGTYEYQTEGMQDMDPELRRELEEANNAKWAPNENEGEEQEQEQEEEEEDSDMDLCGSDSD